MGTELLVYNYAVLLINFTDFTQLNEEMSVCSTQSPHCQTVSEALGSLHVALLTVMQFTPT